MTLEVLVPSMTHSAKKSRDSFPYRVVALAHNNYPIAKSYFSNFDFSTFLNYY